MPRTVDPRTMAALARIMAGEPVSVVALATGVSRCHLHRALTKAGLRAPVKARMGRPAKAVDA